MLQALQKSYSIWRETAVSSTEALKASTVLKMILERVSPTTGKQHSMDLHSDLAAHSTNQSPWPTPGTDSKYSETCLDYTQS
jgi:hypothetical protein